LANQNFKVKNGLTVGQHDIVDNDGNVTVPGDLTVDGNFSIASLEVDEITVNDSVGSDLLPDVTATRDLGSVTRTWNQVHAAEFYGDGSGLTGVTSYTIDDFNDDFATKTTDDLSEGTTNLYYTDARSRAAISVTGSGSYDSNTGVITITGGVSSVNSQTGAVVLTTTDISEGTNLYWTSSRFDSALSGKTTTDLTEGTNLYWTNTRFDNQFAAKSTTNLSEGTNLYWTDARFDTRLATKTTTDISEGTNLYFNTFRARNAISVVDAGGDGSISYDTYSGVITYTGPSAAEVRAHFTAGTGVTITDGVISIDQTGDDVTFSDITVDSIQFNTSASVSVATGQIAWNASEGTFNLGLANGVVLQTGQETNFYAKATEAIANGALVMFAGAQGDHLLIANADLTTPGFQDTWIVGVATQAFANNQYGYVTCFGKVRELNTLAWPEGTILYANPTTPGGLTATRPTAPDRAIEVAAVVRSHGTQGTLLVRPTFGFYLSNLHDVYTNSVADNDLLAWNSANSRWQNIPGTTTSIAEGTNLYYTDARARAAISVVDAGGDGSITYAGGVITYTGPSAAEVRGHFSAGTGVGIVNGEISIGQDVSTSSAVEFSSVTVSASPTQTYHLTNKQYVDNMAQGLATMAPCKIATTGNLTGVYDNGTAGVGATFTIAATATLTIDGNSSWSLNNGILLKDQTDAVENGRYYISQLGSASTDWILTRCVYCDSADEIPGSYILVTDGTDNEGTGWVGFVDDPDTFAVGTDDINYIQFSGAGTYTAGAGLSLVGTTFSNTGVLSVNGVTGAVTAGDILAAVATVDGTGSGLDSDLLDGQDGSYYLDWTNATNKPDPVITVTLTGDVTGSANTTLTDLASGTVTVSTTIEANSVALGTDTTGDYVASLVAGTGIAVGAAGESATPTITNTDPGSSQNIFKNIAVSGQTTVVADSNNDTLTLVAGTNVTITTDAANDTITIAANDSSVDWSEIQNKPDPVITVTLTGDVTGTANTTLTDLASGTVSVATTIAANSVALGTDTTGNYAASVAAGSGITVTGSAGEGTDYTVAHADTSSVGNLSSDNSGNTFIQDISFTFDTYGHVTAASVATGTVSIGDGAMTVTAGSGLTGGGQLGTANQTGASSITISHADTSTASNLTASARTYVTALTFDTYGHVTGYSTGTETVVDTNTTYTAGSGLTLSGTEFSHTDTSSQASVNNSNGTVIQDITLDTYGHITAIGSVDLDSRYVNVTGDSMSGTITVSTPADHDSASVTSLTSAPIIVPEVNVGSASAFLPFLHQKALHTSGYRTHMNLGLYKQASGWGENETGFYVALGGNDNYPTEYFRMTYGGSIKHSNGSVFWHSGNDGSGSGLDADLLDGNDSAYYQKRVSIQDTPPSGSSGDLWYESDSGTLHVYYDSFWIDVAPQVGSSSNLQVNSLGVGTTASGTTGQIRATNDVIAYYSDARLKTFEGRIDNAIDKVKQLNGYYFRENDTARSLGYNNPERQVGVSAQEVQAVLPEVVTTAPVSDDYLTVKYEKLVPLLIEAIKDQQTLIEQLQSRIERLEGQQ